MKKDDIARKIEALLSKTVERGATEAEAIAAALKAQELMAKYDITILGTDDAEEIGNTDLTTTRQWERYLASAVCTNMRCRVLVSKLDRRSFIEIYGFETDRKAALETLMMLLKACKAGIKREKARAKKEYGETAGVEDAYAYSFLRAVQDEMDKTSLALMLVVPESVDEYIEEKFPKIRRTRPRMNGGNGNNESLRSASEAGYADGRSVMGRQQLKASN